MHGIGRPRVPEKELASWTAALAVGANKAAHPDFARALERGDIETRFAYYGDLFGKADGQGDGDDDALDEAEELILAELMAQVVEDRLDVPLDDEDSALLAYANSLARPPEEPQGLGELLRVAIDIAGTLVNIKPLRKGAQWATPHLMVFQLAQVARYLARSEPDQDGVTLDARIRARVTEALGDGPAIVVAHSLGSVVAFETLAEYAGLVDLFVTIGSPLAMRTVVLPRLRPRPPRTPATVRRWLNFWDRDDIFTGRPDLADDILPSESGVEADTARVDSDGLWVHTATKYLAQGDVAGPIAQRYAAAP
ncbi:alpha/beta fold hydrolase [Catenulispora yoronensis]